MTSDPSPRPVGILEHLSRFYEGDRVLIGVDEWSERTGERTWREKMNVTTNVEQIALGIQTEIKTWKTPPHFGL